MDSVLESARHGGVDVALIIVDDGHLGVGAVASLHARAAAAAGVAWTYVRNPAHVGLYASRLAGIAAVHSPMVLFLDDDVTIAPDYLATLHSLYHRHPTAVGIGGIDQLTLPRPAVVRALQRIFLVDSGRPGTLSFSGFAGSIRRWAAQREEFESEYLAGYNMSFRTRALAGLGTVPWLRGYSLGEDLYISHLARQVGELVVSPALRVWHHQSLVSREHLADVARARVVNTYRITRLRGASLVGTLGLLWTVTWLVVKDVLRARRLSQVSGYALGVRDLLRAALLGR